MEPRELCSALWSTRIHDVSAGESFEAIADGAGRSDSVRRWAAEMFAWWKSAANSGRRAMSAAGMFKMGM